MNSDTVRACLSCGKELPKDNKKYCNHLCWDAYRAQRWRRPAGHHGPRPETATPCAVCGAPLKSYRGRFCSLRCRDAYKNTPAGVAARLWPHVDKNGPVPEQSPGLGQCWLALIGRRPDGYVGIYACGKRRLAHRVVWWLEHGRWPSRQVLHHCDNGALGCVRPLHLYEGTDIENAADRVRRGWQVRGEKVGNSKLTPERVLEICAAVAAGEMQKDVAERYGVDQSHVSRMVRGHNWTHLTLERK